MITCGPGSEIYELEGHTALRLQFDDGRDLTVNWGTFDFNSPNFIYRFVKGETDYRMAVLPYSYFVRDYRESGRSVEERTVYLNPEEKERLVWLIDSTLTIGSPVYRYNYVKDNCATRPLDYIEMATGEKISLRDVTALDVETSTFREDMTAFHRNYPWYQFGIDLALGNGIDYKLRPEEHKFAPISLNLMLEGVSRVDSLGNRTPLFGESRTIIRESDGGPAAPTPWPLRPNFVCWMFFALTCIVSFYDDFRKKISRWFDCFYYLLAGLAGLLLTFLIFVSVHESTSPNWLFLWLNPLCFIGAFFIWLKTCYKAVICWQILNFVALAALAVIAMAGIQSLNTAFVPLIAADALRSVVWIKSVKWVKTR